MVAGDFERGRELTSHGNIKILNDVPFDFYVGVADPVSTEI